MAFVKSILIMITSLISGLFADNTEVANRPAEALNTPQSLYDFKVKSLVGNKTIDLTQYKGKKVVILNVASKCGYTKQYADWEKFNKEHGDKVVVLGFPSNNFGGQEPGSNVEIGAFCQKNYGVTFPLAAKVSVKGDDTAPIFQYLTEKELNGVKNTTILWNFTKFLIDENGKLIDTYISTTKPTDKAITKHLQ